MFLTETKIFHLMSQVVGLMNDDETTTQEKLLCQLICF